MTDDSRKGPTRPWGSHSLPGDSAEEIVFGPLRVFVVRAGDELRTAHVRGDPDAEGKSDGDPPDEVAWSRWAAGGDVREVLFTPSLPDRPLIVAPEDPFHLLSGADARIYVRVPLRVKIELEGERRATLQTLFTIPFSDTWWGSLEEGEAAYWLTTHARRRVSHDLFEPHLAICPLRLVNRSEDALTVDKIALRADYLGLYETEGRIWSDETTVRYQGEAEGSRLQMAGRPPEDAPEATLLAPPRLRMARGFRARTFARIRELQEWIV